MTKDFEQDVEEALDRTGGPYFVVMGQAGQTRTLLVWDFAGHWESFEGLRDVMLEWIAEQEERMKLGRPPSEDDPPAC